MSNRSVVVVLGNAPTDKVNPDVLHSCPGRVVRAEYAYSSRASCGTATVEHECDHPAFAVQVRDWMEVQRAAGLDLTATVAPLRDRRTLELYRSAREGVAR